MNAQSSNERLCCPRKVVLSGSREPGSCFDFTDSGTWDHETRKSQKGEPSQLIPYWADLLTFILGRAGTTHDTRHETREENESRDGTGRIRAAERREDPARLPLPGFAGDLLPPAPEPPCSPLINVGMRCVRWARTTVTIDDRRSADDGTLRRNLPRAEALGMAFVV